MLDINELKFDEKGLIPAVVVDAESKKVLTVAYMNRESLEISLKEGKTCFWSRSRQELWRKGETSGNYQHIVSITADCDRDALTVAVKKDGPACHLGTDSCFNDLVYENDIIMINEGDGESLDPNPDLKADILYEDSEVVVFSKPPFMPCHPSIKHRDDTLGNLFAALYPSLAFRPVNRLDRNTSGCVLVAKSQRSAAMLQKSFEKTYVGIIKDLPHCGGRICAPIAREQETIIKRCVRADGQYSATDYLVRKRLGDLSLVDFFLETGRTHQIRVHSAFMGYPLLGDDLYGEASPLISRQALHCEKMTFQSPENGRIVTVTAPLPEDMLCLMTPDR